MQILAEREVGGKIQQKQDTLDYSKNLVHPVVGQV